MALGATTSAQLQAAMRAAGWRIDTDSGLGVSARKGKVAAQLYQQDNSVTVELVRSRPTPVRPLELAGWVAGLLLGWPAALRLIAARRSAHITGLAAAALLLPATVLTTGQLFYESVLPPTITPPALWGDYASLAVHPLALLGATLGALALLLTVLPHPSRPTPE